MSLPLQHFIDKACGKLTLEEPPDFTTCDFCNGDVDAESFRNMWFAEEFIKFGRCQECQDAENISD